MGDSEREGQKRLRHLRQDRDAWIAVACEDGADDEGYWTDAHAADRYSLLLALQYDLRSQDCHLVRFLFQQEALRHRREPYQGLFPALRLAGFLLATYKHVEHVWDFALAKLANFDTYCGFGLQYLVSAGIAETLAFIHANQNPVREEVLKWLTKGGTCVIQEQDLETWWSMQRKAFPSERESESPKVRLDQALQLGDLDEARHWLQVFESAAPRTPSSLHTLAFYWAYLQEWDHAALLTQERLALPDLGQFPRTSAMVSLAGYQRLGKHPNEAWHTLVEARPHLDAGDWWRAGLGRKAVEEAFLLAQMFIAERSIAAGEAYAWAADRLEHVSWAPLHLLEVAESTAETMGDEAARRRYAEMARHEQQSIARKLEGMVDNRGHP